MAGIVTGMVIIIIGLVSGVLVGFDKSLEADITVGVVVGGAGFIVAVIGFGVMLRKNRP